MHPFLRRSIEEARSVEDLEASLEFLLSSGCRVWTGDDGKKFFIETRALIDRVKGLKIVVYAKEHAPPHFHVEGAGIDASFAIENGALLRGTIKKGDAECIELWYQTAKHRLIEVWDATRPTNCPVGPIKKTGPNRVAGGD